MYLLSTGALWSGSRAGSLHAHAATPPHELVAEIALPNSREDRGARLVGVMSLAYVARTCCMWAGAASGAVAVYDVESYKCLHLLSGHTAAVNSLLAKAKYVFSASSDFSVGIWDATKYEPRQFLRGHSNWVRSLALTGLHLWSAGDDGTIVVWSSTGERVSDLAVDDPVHALVYTKFNTVWTGTSSGAIVVFDVTSHACVASLEPLAGWITSLTATDLHVWATCSDGTLALYNAKSRVCLASISAGCGALLAAIPAPLTAHDRSVGTASAWLAAADASVTLWSWLSDAVAERTAKGVIMAPLALGDLASSPNSGSPPPIPSVRQSSLRAMAASEAAREAAEAAHANAEARVAVANREMRSQLRAVTQAHAIEKDGLTTRIELLERERHELALQLAAAREASPNENVDVSQASSTDDPESLASLVATLKSLRGQLHVERKQRAAKEKAMAVAASTAQVRIAQLESELEDVRTTGADTRAAAAAADKQLEALKLQLATQVARADKAESAAAALRKKLRAAESRAKAPSRNEAAAAAASADLRERTLRAEATMLELNKDKATLEETNAELVASLGELRTKLKTTEQARRAGLRKVGSLTNKLDEAVTARADVEAKLAHHRKLVNTITAATHDAEHEIRALEAQHHAAVATLQHQLDSAQTAIDDLESQLHTLQLERTATTTALQAKADAAIAELGSERKMRRRAQAELEKLRAHQLAVMDSAALEAELTQTQGALAAATSQAKQAQDRLAVAERNLETARGRVSAARDEAESQAHVALKLQKALEHVEREREQLQTALATERDRATTAEAAAAALGVEVEREQALVAMASSQGVGVKTSLMHAKDDVVALRKHNVALAAQLGKLSQSEADATREVYSLRRQVEQLQARLEAETATAERDRVSAATQAHLLVADSQASVTAAQQAASREKSRATAAEAQLAVLQGHISAMQSGHASHFDGLEGKLERMRIELEAAENERDAALDEARSATHEASVARSRMARIRDDLEAARRDVAQLKDDLIDARTARDTLTERAQMLAAQLEAASSREQLAADRSAELEARIEEMEAELRRERVAAAEAHGALSSLAADTSAASSTRAAPEVSAADINELRTGLAKAEMRASMAERDAVMANQRRNELQRQIDELRPLSTSTEEELRRQLNSVNQIRGELEQANFILRQKLSDTVSKRELFKSQRDAARSHLQELSRTPSQRLVPSAASASHASESASDDSASLATVETRSVEAGRSQLDSSVSTDEVDARTADLHHHKALLRQRTTELEALRVEYTSRVQVDSSKLEDLEMELRNARATVTAERNRNAQLEQQLADVVAQNMRLRRLASVAGTGMSLSSMDLSSVDALSDGSVATDELDVSDHGEFEET
ncbi:uncharacterized protein AMSG_11495 [Thecamonas trahens ATCC 50062]|uniref:Uncharacterized protein n=1 Tax=Thecamonas trahens ATCC 50062 TaxID=461836 RepID=A0A0L0DY49_THETB|nr:hypothetical protein AMSG_11495 [Thecamonas trahens ATCC 50062]KNC56483.1 hypothetical protein AMSG_11495 [Thecamonas trahens ATCC 50062]|eukprot:XP_013752640.1 hypothetical protein AMSG_11495 [Thecamonas trahens ATCC 50062]